MTYIPPPYRPCLFPWVVRWTLLVIVCFAFVVTCVLLMWVLDGLLK